MSFYILSYRRGSNIILVKVNVKPSMQVPVYTWDTPTHKQSVAMVADGNVIELAEIHSPRLTSESRDSEQSIVDIFFNFGGFVNDLSQGIALFLCYHF